ncbi:MAG: hypothetical protein WAX67_00625, partial [Rugosibacter sp.]
GSRGYRGERYVAAPVYMAPRPVVYYSQPYYSPRVIYVEPRGRGYYGYHHEFRRDRDDWDDHDVWRGGRHGGRHDRGGWD